MSGWWQIPPQHQSTDIYFERYPQKLIDICDKFGYFFRRTIFKHKQYTKRECMISMNADTQDFYESFHITAGFQFLKKNNDFKQRNWMFYGYTVNKFSAWICINHKNPIFWLFCGSLVDTMGDWILKFAVQLQIALKTKKNFILFLISE